MTYPDDFDFEGYRPATTRDIPPCPKCKRKDRLESWWEGGKRIVCCMRCAISGEVRKVRVGEDKEFR